MRDINSLMRVAAHFGGAGVPLWRYVFSRAAGVEADVVEVLCEEPATVAECDDRFARLCELLDLDALAVESDMLFKLLTDAGFYSSIMKKRKESGYWYIQAPDGSVVAGQRHRNPLTLGQRYAKSISREWWDLIAEGYTAVHWPFNDGEDAV